MDASELRPPERPLVDADLSVLNRGEARTVASAAAGRTAIDWVRPAAAAGDATLGRCVGDVARFLHETWEREWWRHAGSETFNDLLALADVDHLIGAQLLRSSHLRMVKDGRPLPPSRYLRSISAARAERDREVVELLAMVADGAPQPAAVGAALGDGASLVLQGLQRYHPPVADFCRELSVVLGHPCHANAYVSPPRSQALKQHTDPHGVFVLQVHGTKRWAIGCAPGSLERQAADLSELELRPGDCLYLPEGTPHAARSQEGYSIHLTIGVEVLRWRDLLTTVLEHALQAGGNGLGQALPAGWPAQVPELEAALGRHLDQLTQLLSAVEPRREAVRWVLDFSSSQRNLPTRTTMRRLLAGAIEDSTPLECQSTAPVGLLDTDPSRVAVLLGDRVLLLPRELRPEIRTIVSRRSFAARDLTRLDLASRLLLCRWLEDQRLVAIAVS